MTFALEMTWSVTATATHDAFCRAFGDNCDIMAVEPEVTHFTPSLQLIVARVGPGHQQLDIGALAGTEPLRRAWSPVVERIAGHRTSG